MKVIILRGISGSGKTHLRRNLCCGALIYPTVHVCADDFFEEDGKYRFDRTKLQAAHGDCLRRYVDILTAVSPEAESRPAQPPKLVAVDNTNTRIAEVAPYYQLALAYGHDVLLATLICSPQIAWDRSSHRTSREVIWAQHQRIMTEQVPPWWNHRIGFAGSLVMDRSAEGWSAPGTMFNAQELLEACGEPIDDDAKP